MVHVFELAPTGRAKCRGCEQLIAKGEMRFGEHVPNPFGEGDATLWFHPRCAAFRRPEAMIESLAMAPEADQAELERIARASAAQHRVQRIAGAERSPSGKAACRHCRQAIEKDSWRIKLAIYEDGRFVPAGFIHLACRPEYFEGADVTEAVMHFSAALGDDERAELRSALSP
jgi:hypothetical protein